MAIDIPCDVSSFQINTLDVWLDTIFFLYIFSIAAVLNILDTNCKKGEIWKYVIANITVCMMRMLCKVIHISDYSTSPRNQ